MDENEKKALLELLELIKRKDIKISGLTITFRVKVEKPNKAKSKE